MPTNRVRAIATAALLSGWIAWEVPRTSAQQPAGRRGALRIAKLRHSGHWDIAPNAIPVLSISLRDVLRFNVVLDQKDLSPREPGLVHYPLVYLGGDAAFAFEEQDRIAVLRHLDPGGATLFADAARGSDAFDAAFRRFVADLIPANPLVPIPPDDPLLSGKSGYDLTEVRLNRAAGGRAGPPTLEGIKVGARWAVIYSKLDIGCAIDNPAGENGRGYEPADARKIATNRVRYALEP